MKHLFLSLIISGLLFSCTSPKKIANTLNTNPYNLSEILPKAAPKFNSSVLNINISLVDSALPPLAQVKKEKAWLVPLVLVNFWHAKYECIGGQKMFYQDINTYLTDNFLYSMINISDSRPTTDNPDAPYQLKVKVEQIRYVCHYSNNGMLLMIPPVFSITRVDKFFNGDASVKMSYELYYKNKLVETKRVDHTTNMMTKTNRYKKKKHLQQGMGYLMVDALGNAMELTVTEINERVYQLMLNNKNQ